MHTVTVAVHLFVRSIIQWIGLAWNDSFELWLETPKKEEYAKRLPRIFDKEKPVLSPIHMHTLIFSTEILKWKVVLLISISFKFKPDILVNTICWLCSHREKNQLFQQYVDFFLALSFVRREYIHFIVRLHAACSLIFWNKFMLNSSRFLNDFTCLTWNDHTNPLLWWLHEKKCISYKKKFNLIDRCIVWKTLPKI